MEPWFEELLSSWNESVDDMAQELLAAYERDPLQKGKWDLNTLRQLVHGGLAMMSAEYAGHGTETREAYLESTIPGLYAAGSTLPLQCGSTIEVAMRTYSLLMERISPQNREKAGDFVSRTWGRYVFDLVRVGINLLNQEAT